MKKNDKRQLDNNFIEQKVAEAFGYTDEHLAADLDRFVEEAEKSNNKALEAPKGEFERIWDRVERDRGSHQRKSGRVRKFVKVMAIVAVLGTMMLGGGMWVGAKKHYVYEVRERGDLENVIAINNNPDAIGVDDNDDERAYRQISKELGVEVLELSYLPKEMVFAKIKIFESKSRMEFVSGQNWLFFYQGINDRPSSLSYVSDMKECTIVHNSFLNEDIPVYEEVLQNGNVELSIRIVTKNYYYILEGLVDIDEFVQVVRGIKPFDN